MRGAGFGVDAVSAGPATGFTTGGDADRGTEGAAVRAGDRNATTGFGRGGVIGGVTARGRAPSPLAGLGGAGGSMRRDGAGAALTGLGGGGMAARGGTDATRTFLGGGGGIFSGLAGIGGTARRGAETPPVFPGDWNGSVDTRGPSFACFGNAGAALPAFLTAWRGAAAGRRPNLPAFFGNESDDFSPVAPESEGFNPGGAGLPPNCGVRGNTDASAWWNDAGGDACDGDGVCDGDGA